MKGVAPPGHAEDIYVLLLLFALLILSAPVFGDVKIDVSPDNGALKDNLLASLSFKDESCDSPHWLMRRLVKQADKDLKQSLRAFGYYSPRIERKLTFDESCWHAHFQVEAGMRVTISNRNIHITGEIESDEAYRVLLTRLPLAPGSPLNHGDYESLKAQLLDFAAERGYLDFQLNEKQLRVNPSQGLAEIVIGGTSGSRYRFGDLHFAELPLDNTFLLHLAGLQSGELFDVRQLNRVDRNLVNSGYFSSVNVSPRREDASDGVVPLRVDLQMAPRHKWKAGAGYSTNIGPGITFGYENRYLNREGNKFASELRLSPVESGLNASYILPGEDPHKIETVFGVSALHEDTVTARTDSVTFTVLRAYKTGHRTRTPFIELLYERSEIAGATETSTLLMPGLKFSRIRADDLTKVSKGHKISLDSRIAHDSLLSTTSLLQLKGYYKQIHRFANAGRITGRVEAGYTHTKDLNKLPTTLRFFAGGDNSVRGYEYESLGPLDNAGNVIGGRNLLVGSAEYEHPVVGDDWWVAGFLDAGNSFNGSKYDPKIGYGIGARWYSPIGRVRLDLAFPHDNTVDSWRIHFSLGADL